MQVVVAIIGLGLLFVLLDGEVSKPNPGEFMKLIYLVVGGLFVFGLALIALACFTYPLWQGEF